VRQAIQHAVEKIDHLVIPSPPGSLGEVQHPAPEVNGPSVDGPALSCLET